MSSRASFSEVTKKKEQPTSLFYSENSHMNWALGAVPLEDGLLTDRPPMVYTLQSKPTGYASNRSINIIGWTFIRQVELTDLSD